MTRPVPPLRSAGLALLLAATALSGCRTGADDGVAGQFARLGLDTRAAPPAPGLEAPAADARPPARPVIVRGGQAGPAVEAGGPDLSDEATLTLDFEEGSLREFVATVLGDLLGLTYVFDPRVQGTVSIDTGRPLSRRDALGLVETVLRMNGAALVRGDGALKVVPLAEARQSSGGPVGFGSDAGGYAVSVLPLRHVSAQTVQQLIEPIYQVSGSIVAEPGLNLLMVAGTADERRTIVAAARAFDVDWMKGRSVGIFPLEQSSPGPVIRELQAIFNAGPQGASAGAVTFLPVERLNAVMAVTAQGAWLDQVGQWVERLDRGSADQRGLYVHPLQHAEARDVARLLTRLFGRGGGREEAEERVTAPGREQATLSAGPATVSNVPPGATGLPGGNPPRQGLAAIARDGGGAVEPGAEEETAAEGGVRIVADNQNNALLILASVEEYRLIDQALKKLDLMPLQVMIEATIAEVTLNDALRYGVQNFFKNNSGDLQGGFTLSENALRPSAQLPGFNLILSRAGDPRAVLSALSEVTDVRVVSSPQLVVRDNQEATLTVGDKVPVTTRQVVDATVPNAPTANSIEYVDTGVILGVRPRITQGGMVAMEVFQEVSNVNRTANTGALTPTIARRAIDTSVSVRTGQTVVLGGLISDRETQGRSGIPLLSDIPGLGALFSERTRGAQRTELIVFITPRIVRNPDDAQAVTEELMRRIRALNPAVPSG
ncbi:MAG TPA: type II secretion system secretin GspD [Azospirillaceae bacterium]|nr:type II secretion system secretin GspD [Azospirillaceae bacterium]